MLCAFKRSLVLAERFSSNNARKTFVNANGVVVCWHPQTAHPYEHTKSINLNNIKEERSPLDTSILRRRPKVPENSELKEIFYTPKNEWYTRTREARLLSVAPPLPKKRPT